MKDDKKPTNIVNDPQPDNIFQKLRIIKGEIQNTKIEVKYQYQIQQYILKSE